MLHHACEKGCLEIIKWILHKNNLYLNNNNDNFYNNDHNNSNNNNNTNINNTTSSINLKTKILKKTPLMISVENNQLDVVLFFMKMPQFALTINTQDSNGNTALHYAATFSTPLIIEILLICNANKNIRNKNNRTAIDEAKTKKSRMFAVTTIQSFVNKSNNDYMLKIKFLNEYHDLKNR